MRALLQRVAWARVRVDGDVVGAIDGGLAVLLGVGIGDTEADARKLAAKVRKLRVFPDEHGKMNRSVEQAGGGVLVVSQFTLYADLSSGNRPGFGPAAAPDLAERLYEAFVAVLADAGIPTATGIFGADMDVELVNRGPVTLWLDTDA
jgi:D-tyrosyl-tRNA(Tyr) deacylase